MCYGMPISVRSLQEAGWRGWGKASFPPIIQIFPLCTQIFGIIANPQRSTAFKMVITNKLMRKGNTGHFLWLEFYTALLWKDAFQRQIWLPTPPTINWYKNTNLLALSTLWTHFLWLTLKWYKYFYLKGELQLLELGSDSFFYSYRYSG